MDALVFPNPNVTAVLDRRGVGRDPLVFHRRLPGYAPTRLVDAPELAAHLGVGAIWIKDESHRLGLPSFKILGASWAIYRALEARLGRSLDRWSTFGQLVEHVAPLRPLRLAAATDGNHGRAVARVAAQLGFGASIYVPAGMAEARIRAIQAEGADVIVVDGTYDDAVACSAREAGERCLVISDTAWPGYEDVPTWVIEGYATILCEIDEELARRGLGGPDLIVVQIGVGALAAAVTRHYRSLQVRRRPKIVGVEPIHAACVLRSMEAGQIVAVPGPHDSIMAGLNCGTPSLIAWPIVSQGIDLFLAIADERAREAMRLLASAGLIAGETGAAGFGGLIELIKGDDADARQRLGLGASTRVVVIATEGATDPRAYQQIVG
ncbi:MAG: diaminopropionate ammonia-lyase, partial [Chloroflexota bacterium]|nr:diaminopropionate ammonia-lyase [Chloroflexota bacterium]